MSGTGRRVTNRQSDRRALLEFAALLLGSGLTASALGWKLGLGVALLAWFLKPGEQWIVTVP